MRAHHGRAAIRAQMFSVRIVTAPGDACANPACLTGRPGNRQRLTGGLGLAEATAPLDMPIMLLVAARLGLGRCTDQNHHQCGCACGQRQKSDRNSHAFLLRVIVRASLDRQPPVLPCFLFFLLGPLAERGCRQNPPNYRARKNHKRTTAQNEKK